MQTIIKLYLMFKDTIAIVWNVCKQQTCKTEINSESMKQENYYPVRDNCVFWQVNVQKI